MNRPNLLRLIGEDPRGPQGIAEVVAPALELGGKSSVDGEGAAGEELVDAEGLGGAQM